MSQAPPPTPGPSTAGPPAQHTDGVVRVEHLTKTFGSGPGAVHAVHDLSFEVRPGRVTGFLGPNGAGKTTTLRMLLGLVAPTSGTATIGGRRYDQIERPAHVVGAALEAASFHPGRTARDHLRVYAPQVGVPDSRADEVLALVGLAEVAKRRVGGFSLGMRQRLALATTLLGDPPVLLLDEPANGLDPEGIAWLRGLLRALAREGRTVLVSSHVLSEVEQTVDDVVIIARGQLVHASSLPDLARLARPRVSVVSPDAAALDALVAAHGWTVGASGRDGDAASYELLDVSAAQVGAAAFGGRVELHRLAGQDVGLEDLFLQLTAAPAQQTSAEAPAPGPGPAPVPSSTAPQTDAPAGGER
ncbi:ABC transporter ATP-binding protein [Cellulomonas persica]|uniref:ABC transporter ATP-binding protein n=1 Tax=Cellulomonas persica TaxID=76861 RepID=A0A510UPQ6_9CELL|nr:ABC transporter ATP-binding protein [Cellulomonas persica]GEK16539.1 ABC transporter ATP-binding protein [Cellulomonas persica]